MRKKKENEREKKREKDVISSQLHHLYNLHTTGFHFFLFLSQFLHLSFDIRITKRVHSTEAAAAASSSRENGMTWVPSSEKLEIAKTIIF